jgi:hypothetical protein
MAELFGRDKSVVSRHLSNIFRGKELSRRSVVAENATTAADGKTYQVEHYNLDAIISVGYGANTKRGTQFRIWATRTLREHLLRGYTLNERRFRESPVAGAHSGPREWRAIERSLFAPATRSSGSGSARMRVALCSLSAGHA